MQLTQGIHRAVQLHPDRPALLCDEVTAAEIVAFCRDKIAHYKSPKTCEIRAYELPKSGAGKIMKAELRKPFWKDATRGIN